MTERLSRRSFLKIALAVPTTLALEACGQDVAPNPPATTIPTDVLGSPVPTVDVTTTQIAVGPTIMPVTATLDATALPPTPPVATETSAPTITPEAEKNLLKEFEILETAERTTKNGDVKIVVQGTLNQTRLNIDEVSKTVANLLAESREFLNSSVAAVAKTLVVFIEKATSSEELSETDIQTLINRTQKLRTYLDNELQPRMSKGWIKNVTGTEQADLSEEIQKISEPNTKHYVFEDTQAAAYAGIISIQADFQDTQNKIVNGNSELETFAETCAELIAGISLWSATERDVADESQGEPEKLIKGRKIVTGEDEIVESTPEATNVSETDIYVPYETEIKFNGGLVKIRLLVDEKAFEEKGITGIEDKLNTRKSIFGLAYASGNVISQIIEYCAKSGYDLAKIDSLSKIIDADQYTSGLGSIRYSEADPDFTIDSAIIPTDGKLEPNQDENTIVSEDETLTLIKIDDKRNNRYSTKSVLTDIEIYSNLPKKDRLSLEKIAILIKYIQETSAFCDLAIVTSILSDKELAGENSINYVKGQQELLANHIQEQTRLITSN